VLSAILVAGGSSQRMGFDKLFAVIAGEPVIAHPIRAFERATSVGEIVVVAREDRHDEIRKISRDRGFKKVLSIVPAANVGRIPSGLAWIASIATRNMLQCTTRHAR